MSDGLPSKAVVRVPGKSVSIDTTVYFVAKRMENAGTLRPGQALMLAAALSNPKPQKRGTAKRGKR